jgi:hypothetical protein
VPDDKFFTTGVLRPMTIPETFYSGGIRMAVRGQNLIVCDSCGQRLVVPVICSGYDRPELVRGYAHEQRWTTDAGLDLCPVHSHQPAESRWMAGDRRGITYT